MADQLAKLYSDVLSDEASIRDAATAGITKAKANEKEFILLSLEIFTSHPSKDIRRQATVQIRNTILNTETDMSEISDIIIKTCITCLQNPEFSDDLSRLIMSLCVRDMWNTAVNDLLQVYEQCQDKNALALRIIVIIGDVVEFSRSTFDIEKMKNLLATVFQLDALAGSQALIQVVIGTNDDMRYMWPELVKFTPMVLECLRNIDLDIGGLNTLVEKMIELCDVRGGSFFTPHAAEVMKVMTFIICHKDMNSEYRVFCASFLEYLITDRPKMCKEIPGLVDTLVEASFQMVLDVDEDDVFDARDEFDAPPSSAGEALLDIISKSFDAADVMPKIFDHIRALVPSPDWKYRRAAIVAIAQTVEFIPKENQKSTLVEMLPVVINAASDVNEVVRYSAAKCISQIAFDLAPLFQVCHKDEVLPVLNQLLQDPNEHVVLKTMKAFNNFSEGLTPSDLENYLPQLMDNVVQRIQSSADEDMKSGAFLMIGSAANSAKMKFSPMFDVIAPLAMTYIRGNSPNVRSKALETLTIMCDATQKFPEYGQKLVETILNLFREGVSDEDPIHESAIYSLGRIVTVLGDGSAPFLADIVDQFLPALDFTPQIYQNFNDNTLATIGAIVQHQGQYMTLTRGVCNEVKNVLNLLISCMVACENAYMSLIDRTVLALIKLLESKFSVDFLERILECVAVVVEHLNTKPQYHDTIRRLVTLSTDVSLKFLEETSQYHDPSEQYDEHVIEVQEELSNVSLTLAEVFKKCPTDILAEEMVASVAEKSFRIMDSLQSVERERFEKMARNAVDVEDRQRVDKDRELSSEYQQSIQALTGGLMKSHPEAFIKHAGQLTEQVIKLYINSKEPGDFVIGCGCASNIIEFLNEKGYGMWELFIDHLISGCSSQDPSVRHTCTYAIQQAVKQRPFTDDHVKRVVTELGKCIAMHDVESVDISYATDNAVSALFAILRHRYNVLGQAGCQEAAHIIFKHLPTVVDVVENLDICKALIECIKNEEMAVLGDSHSNLGIIIAVLAKSYNTANSDKTLDDEICTIISTLGKERLLNYCANIDAESQPYIERLFRDCTEMVQSI